MWDDFPTESLPWNSYRTRRWRKFSRIFRFFSLSIVTVEGRGISKNDCPKVVRTSSFDLVQKTSFNSEDSNTQPYAHTRKKIHIAVKPTHFSVRSESKTRGDTIKTDSDNVRYSRRSEPHNYACR